LTISIYIFLEGRDRLRRKAIKMDRKNNEKMQKEKIRKAAVEKTAKENVEKLKKWLWKNEDDEETQYLFDLIDSD
jgi:hypothetical protein